MVLALELNHMRALGLLPPHEKKASSDKFSKLICRTSLVGSTLF